MTIVQNDVRRRMMSSLRPSRDEILMRSAWLWSERSTCSRLHVGAVFSRDGRILVTGYNGTPAGLPHCDHTCTCVGTENVRMWVEAADKSMHLLQCPSQSPCTNAEHAERNGIAYAARNGVRLEGCELFLTDSPCLECARSIINAGVERAVYDREYRLTEGVELLRQAGIVVEQFELY